MESVLGRRSLPIFAIVVTAFAAAAPEEFINGDAVVYAEQIEHANFAERTTHLGYYLLAYPLSLLPFSLSHLLNLLNCALGAGVVVVAGLIGEGVSGSKTVGLLSCLIVTVNCFLVGNSLNAEVYVPQVFFLLLAMHLWLRGWTVASGLSCGVAFVITASSAFAAPFFIIMRPRWRPLIVLGTVAFTVVAAVLAPVIDNYLFGARGLMGAAKHGIDYELVLLKTGRDVFFGFFGLIPFLFAGVVECRHRPDLRRFTLAVAATWGTVFIFGEKYLDVPVQLPTYTLGGIIAAIGIKATLDGRRGPAIVGAALGLCIAGIVLLVTPFVPADYVNHLPTTTVLILYATAVALTASVLIGWSSTEATVIILVMVVACNLTTITGNQIDVHGKLIQTRALAQQVQAKSNTIVVAKWNDAVRLNWLVHGRAYHASTFDVDAIDGRHRRRADMESFSNVLRHHPRILLLSSTSKILQILRTNGYRPDRDTHWWIKGE